MLHNEEMKKKSVELGLFSSLDELQQYETELIENYYPGREKLTNEEILRYGDCVSEHQFQVLIALDRKRKEGKC